MWKVFRGAAFGIACAMMRRLLQKQNHNQVGFPDGQKKRQQPGDLDPTKGSPEWKNTAWVGP